MCSTEAKQQIAFILEKISALRPAERLLLYLKMPGGHSEVGEHHRSIKYLHNFLRKTSDKADLRLKQSDKPLCSCCNKKKVALGTEERIRIVKARLLLFC